MAFLLLIGGVRKGTKIGLGYEGVRNCIKCYVSRHIETTELIPKISVLFSFLRAILLGFNSRHCRDSYTSIQDTSHL